MRGPVSIVVSSWNPIAPRFDTIAASSIGNGPELIHALIVRLPVILRAVGLPRSTTSSFPSSTTAPPCLPVPQVAPCASVPVIPPPDASAAVVPDPSSNA